MSNLPLTNLAAMVAPGQMQGDMHQPAPVDAVMPQQNAAQQKYLEALGQLLHDHAQQPQQPVPTGSSNPYALNNAQNPYAVKSAGPMSALASKLHPQASTTTPAKDK